MRGDDVEIFPGKTFSSLLKDIYDISSKKRLEIDSTIKSLDNYINNMNDAVQLGEILQKLMDTSIKNDDQLVKMAQIVQKVLLSELKETSSGPSDITDFLSEAEKETLIKSARNLKLAQDSISEEVDELKRKVK